MLRKGIKAAERSAQARPKTAGSRTGTAPTEVDSDSDSEFNDGLDADWDWSAVDAVEEEILALSHNEIDREKHQLFVDLGVYTRNRAFRLYASCKRGKFPHILQPLGTNMGDDFTSHQHGNFNSGWFPSDVSSPGGESKLFLASLVCPMTRAEATAAAAAAAPTAATRSKFSLLPCPLGNQHDGNGNAGVKSSQGGASSSNCQSNGVFMESKSSPFPQLDKLVLAQLALHGNAGYIRAVVVFRRPGSSEVKTVIFEIGGNRWCGKVGRSHRSNHVMYVIVLDSRCCRSTYKPT